LSLDELLDLEGLISLCIAGLFFIGLVTLLHPRIGGNSLRPYLVIVAGSSCLFFVTSAFPLLTNDILGNQDILFRMVVTRAVTRLLVPASLFLLAYKTIRKRHD
jgi:hypothetical protein